MKQIPLPFVCMVLTIWMVWIAWDAPAQSLKPVTTPRISVVAFEQMLDGSVRYTLKRDSVGGTCWWEVRIADEGVYAVPVTATACLATP